MRNILIEIEKTMSRQPLSINLLWADLKDKFCCFTIVQGMKFILTPVIEGKVLALVSDEESETYKTRLFNFSNSDKQWKSVPGISGRKQLKGDHRNSLNHYVQAGKIHKDLYRVLDRLPKSRALSFNLLSYVPNMKGGEESLVGEFEYKEEYGCLANPAWRKFQLECQETYSFYSEYILKFESIVDFSPEGDFYAAAKGSNIAELHNLCDVIDDISRGEEVRQGLKNVPSSAFFEKSPHKMLQIILKAYRQNVGKVIVEKFQKDMPSDMVPDFNRKKIIDSYTKKDIKNSNHICIEEFDVSSPEGDKLIFAMAHDKAGRTYIDNIYSAHDPVTDYGVTQKMVQMGHLIYKPQDYASQAFILPSDYIKVIKGSPYVDINRLWQLVPVIKKYRDELRKRKSWFS